MEKQSTEKAVRCRGRFFGPGRGFFDVRERGEPGRSVFWGLTGNDRFVRMHADPAPVV